MLRKQIIFFQQKHIFLRDDDKKHLFVGLNLEKVCLETADLLHWKGRGGTRVAFCVEKVSHIGADLLRATSPLIPLLGHAAHSIIRNLLCYPCSVSVLGNSDSLFPGPCSFFGETGSKTGKDFGRSIWLLTAGGPSRPEPVSDQGPWQVDGKMFSLSGRYKTEASACAQMKSPSGWRQTIFDLSPQPL